ncbi:MAG TPA: ribosome-associated translation inhibitor RaiA [Gemmatimonadota bacterium]|nr:ribosome-associated translation inhibitor RaiA [Gemmatimonadota bacterium]
MEITLSIRHGEAPDAMKVYVRQEVDGLSKYFERLVEADIVLDQEGHRSIAEVRIHTSNDTHYASSEAGDLRTAIDSTIGKLKRQLKRHKEKLTRRQLTKIERERIYGAAARPDRQASLDPAVAPIEWDRISSQEAITRLSASDEDILVFVDTRDGVVKIARRDGAESVSVVEAETFEVEER